MAQWPPGKEVCSQAQGPAREPMRGLGQSHHTQAGTEGPGAAGPASGVVGGPTWSGLSRPVCALKALTASFFSSACSF